MTPTRLRRIFRRAVMALAGLLSLMVWYIATFGACHWYAGRQIVSGNYAPIPLNMQLKPFGPLYRYEETDWPGAHTLSTWHSWCVGKGKGSGMTWEQARQESLEVREYERRKRERRETRR